ncbi:hypothetical protein FQR65_LT00724 [Abscondita terminalis]|nr:hypothetical protein FQR65_LT00724 [Abscondita terminalis]
MGKSWLYILFLLWFSYLLVSSILLFTHGFLLSRITQTSNASCTQHLANYSTKSANNYIYDIDNELLKSYLQNASHVCLPKRARIILIIIDALRYDFAKYDSTIKNPAPFQNKLPIIDKLLRNSQSSRLYKFTADPPTTTMQRLKAITTGSLPTFVDAGSNFASPEINEDNIIDQLRKQFRDIVVMGDDTWESLYPNRFKRSYLYPSFNVLDLDTVDDGIMNNLFTEMEEKDWDLLIAHFLGVDHCGHRYGPVHPEMSRKLTQMDQVIQKVVMKLDEHSMLFVIGDHGMTNTGDHGGESYDEVNSAMFVHSKKKLIPTDIEFDRDIIKQIDLVPTLAIIMGIPIPHSNLGSLVIDALPILDNQIATLPEWYFELFSICSNIQQMTKFIKEYAISSDTFGQKKLQNLYEKYILLNSRMHLINNESAFKSFVKQAKSYKILLRKMCEEVWVQFDSFSMSRGLVLSFMPIFLVYMIVGGIPNDQLPDIIKSSFLPCSCVALLFSIAISITCFYFNLVDHLSVTIYFATGLVSVFMLSVLVIQNWELISIHCWCGLLSNSYIVEEDKVSMFLLFTTIIATVYDGNLQKKVTWYNSKNKFNWIKIKTVLLVIFAGILNRLSTTFFKCREEQLQCHQSLHSQRVKSGLLSNKAEYLVTLVVVAVFITTTRMWLRSCGNLVGLSPKVVLAKYAPTIMVIATGGFWILHGLSPETKNNFITGFKNDSLALVVYILVIAGILSIIFNPLCIYILPNDDAQTYNEDETIPQIFNRVKGLFNQTNTEKAGKIPIVCGLATVYSSAFIIVTVYICLLIVLLLGDVIAPSVVLLYFSSVMVLIVSSLIRIEKAISSAQLFEVPNLYILAWMLMSLYFFYAFGHQATFSSISWEAAFIGTGGNFTNNVIPGLLIIINTFGAFILMGFTLPLLLIAPFTFAFMCPSLCNKRTDDSKLLKDVSRGEIILYEKEGVMFNGVFTISCKYILFHAVRVIFKDHSLYLYYRHCVLDFRLDAGCYNTLQTPYDLEDICS